MKLRLALPVTEQTTMAEARRLLQEGRPEEALFLVAVLVEQTPAVPDARALLEECGAAVERDCWTAIGSPKAALVVAVPPDVLKGLGLDNVSGFLLSLMDGVTDVEVLLDLSGLPRLLALRHVRDLVSRRIAVVGKRRTQRR